MRRGTLQVVMAVTMLGALAACGSSPADPPTTRPTSASPSPSATPSPTPTDPAAVAPERSSVMDTADSHGAEAFATYFMELVPYVYATGEVGDLRELSHPECIFCADVITKAEAQATAGGHTTGGLVDIREVTALEVDPGAWWAVSMDVVQASLEDIDRSGAVVGQAPETAYHLEMSVVLANGVWQMRAVTPEAT